jgi:hypothetical protein
MRGLVGETKGVPLECQLILRFLPVEMLMIPHVALVAISPSCQELAPELVDKADGKDVARAHKDELSNDTKCYYNMDKHEEVCRLGRSWLTRSPSDHDCSHSRDLSRACRH